MSGTVVVSLTDSEIAYLLCSAREGGSNYWAFFHDCPYTFDSKDLTPLLLPASVLDREEDREMILDRSALQRGVQALGLSVNGRVLGEVLTDNADGNTADIFLQLCLFGEVIYG